MEASLARITLRGKFSLIHIYKTHRESKTPPGNGKSEINSDRNTGMDEKGLFRDIMSLWLCA